MSVAESTVIFAPMYQFGCATACSRVTAQVGAAAERAAAGGEDEPVDRARPLAGEQLEEGGVLGVHRQELRARGLRERGHQLAAHHQALLVGEREVDALTESGNRGTQAGRASQRVQHEIAVGIGDQLDQPLGTREHLGLGVLGRARGRVRVRERYAAHPVLLRLLEEQLPARRRGEAHNLELGVALDHVERLRADGAGGADYQDPAHPSSVRGTP